MRDFEWFSGVHTPFSLSLICMKQLCLSEEWLLVSSDIWNKSRLTRKQMTMAQRALMTIPTNCPDRDSLCIIYYILQLVLCQAICLVQLFSEELEAVHTHNWVVKWFILFELSCLPKGSRPNDLKAHLFQHCGYLHGTAYLCLCMHLAAKVIDSLVHDRIITLQGLGMKKWVCCCPDGWPKLSSADEEPSIFCLYSCILESLNTAPSPVEKSPQSARSSSEKTYFLI